jgi:hypothetical protein
MSTTVVTVEVGGTGANNATQARVNLGAAPTAAYVQANSAFDQANAAYTQANTALNSAGASVSWFYS